MLASCCTNSKNQVNYPDSYSYIRASTAVKILPRYNTGNIKSDLREPHFQT